MRGLAKIVCLSLLLAACGGASDSPPAPLSKHFDDMYIARIPLDQKQSIVQTQNDWAVAKMENANAEANFQETENQLHQAQNDQKATRLSMDSAVSAKKMAEQSADQNRINQAVKDLRAAEDLGKAADARVKYLQQYRGYLKRYWRYTQENMYWREAQFEAAKAQLAKQNNIAPKGVVYDAFPKQLDERQKRTQSAKEKAEADKQKTVSARETWLKIQDQADKESGKQSNLWDPMASAKAAAEVGGTSGQVKPEIKSNPTTPSGAPSGGTAEGSAAGSASPTPPQ